MSVFTGAHPAEKGRGLVSLRGTLLLNELVGPHQKVTFLLTSGKKHPLSLFGDCYTFVSMLYIYMCKYTYTYIHIHAHTYTDIRIHTHTCTHIHIHTHTYTNVHIHTHTYQFIPIHTNTYQYIPIHTNTGEHSLVHL